jgi:hypothetical protein
LAANNSGGVWDDEASLKHTTVSNALANEYAQRRLLHTGSLFRQKGLSIAMIATKQSTLNTHMHVMAQHTAGSFVETWLCSIAQDNKAMNNS